MFQSIFIDKKQKEEEEEPILLKENCSILIYDINCNLIAIKFNNFFDFNNNDDIISLLDEICKKKNTNYNINYDNDLLDLFYSPINKLFKKHIKKIENSFIRYFFISNPKYKLFTTKFINIQFSKNKIVLNNEEDKLKTNSFSSFFFIHKKDKNTNVIFKEYNIDIPIINNKDLLIFDTKSIDYKIENDKNEKVYNIKISS